MARARRMVMRGRQPGRTNWSRIVPAAWSTVPAGNKLLFTTFVLDNPGISETVRRCRGRFYVASDQGASIEEISGAWGAVVITDAAAAIGITAIPGAVTDASDDNWFLWEPFGSHLSNGPGSNVSAAPEPAMEFDSKAMRKVESGFQLAFVVENASASTGLLFSAGISLLSSRS